MEPATRWARGSLICRLMAERGYGNGKVARKPALAPFTPLHRSLPPFTTDSEVATHPLLPFLSVGGEPLSPLLSARPTGPSVVWYGPSTPPFPEWERHPDVCLLPWTLPYLDFVRLGEANLRKKSQAHLSIGYVRAAMA